MSPASLLAVATFTLAVGGNAAIAQPTPASLGLTHLQFTYEGDPVDVLIAARALDTAAPKPLMLFLQGSLPVPLIQYDAGGPYGVWPFDADVFSRDYHLAIIGKPYVPLVADASTLSGRYYVEASGQIPAAYSARNLLGYYVGRAAAIADSLQALPFVSDERLVVAGHSEGSTVAAKWASVDAGVTDLMYASGSPLGRVMTQVARDRHIESDTDSTRHGERLFAYWADVLADSSSMDATLGDTPRVTYEMSVPPIDYLRALDIPIHVSYGTRDYSTPANDFLRADLMRRGRTNVTYLALVGREHNFFPVSRDLSEVDYADGGGWARVAEAWAAWLRGRRD